MEFEVGDDGLGMNLGRRVLGIFRLVGALFSLFLCDRRKVFLQPTPLIMSHHCILFSLFLCQANRSSRAMFNFKSFLKLVSQII